MKKHLKTRFIAVLSVLCMAMSAFSVPTFASETDVQSSSAEDISSNDTSITSEESSTPPATDSTSETDDVKTESTSTESTTPEAVPEGENNESTESVEAFSSNGPVNSVIAEESPVSDDFKETGIFDCNVVDANGTCINAWYDDTNDTYYMFLTSACRISDITLNVTGVRVSSVSAGTIDTYTNTVSGAFAASGDVLTITDKDGEDYTVIVMQSGLPSINITLNGIDLNTLQDGSKETKYKNNTVIITDADGNVNVSESEKVEIKGRGNSTWDWSDKKPYQIKFNKKQSVLGMAKAKKWILLANAFDDSMLKNKIAYYMADELNMTYSPDYEYADLWIDGEYRGTYMIGEKVEIDNNRLNLTNDDGLIMEYDAAFYTEENYGFYDSYLKNHFTLKEAVNEDSDAKIKSNVNMFQQKLDTFMSFLTNTNLSGITLSQLGKYIDVDSFAKYYLVSEYLGNHEAYVSSWFWYVDGASDVLHLGPVWDYDTCMKYGSDDQFGKNASLLFNALMKIPSFSNYVNKLFSENKSMISGLASYASGVADTISGSADMNYTRWKFLGKKTQKLSNSSYFANTYDEAVSTLTSWLNSRYSWYDSNMAGYPSALLDYDLSSSGQTLYVKAADIKGTNSLSAAVWSDSNGQDDLKWYSFSGGSTKNLTIDLSRHGSSDTYYVHVYANGSLISTWSEQVEMNTAGSVLTAEYNTESGTIEAGMSYADDYTDVSFAVWSDENGQDDLKWYSVSADSNGTASISINPIAHNSSGKYYIHAYGKRNGKQSFITSTEVTVPDTYGADITVEKQEGTNALQINVSKAGGFSSLSAAVWGSKDNQNDLKWYELTKVSEGVYTGVSNLETHGETGQYNIHIYGKYNGSNVFMGGVTYDLDSLEAPSVSAEETEEGKTLKVNLLNGGLYTKVSFAVWGDKNDQNDLAWYSASKDSSGCWSASVNLLNHGETGEYHIHVYAQKSGGRSKCVTTCNYNVNALKIPYIDCKVSSSGKILKPTLYNAEDYSSISYAVWSDKNGQDDLTWYTAGKKTDGTWLSTINLASHGDTGIYYVHAYGIRNGKQTFIGGETITVNKFLSPQLSLSENSGHILATALKNAEDYSSLRFAVWTLENGQDDLKWYNANKYSNGIWRYSVKTKEHLGNGTYVVHAYGTKNGKSSYLTGTTFTIDSYNDSVVSAVKADDSNILNITVEPSFGYDSVSAAVWCDTNDQNDLKWYTLTKDSNDNFSTSVDLGSHGETGNYLVHIYSSYNGLSIFDVGTVVSVDKLIEPKITLENTNNSLNISCSNLGYCNKVSFAVWNDENGQDDLKWYTGKRSSDGTWTCEASTLTHGASGNYNIHIYGTVNGKSKFITSDMIAA